MRRAVEINNKSGYRNELYNNETRKRAVVGLGAHAIQATYKYYTTRVTEQKNEKEKKVFPFFIGPPPIFDGCLNIL